MCTAATYKTKDFYFGRTLDYDRSYGEEIIVTPRRFPFSFRHEGEAREHYAMIGMAFAPENYPLYYDAVNEKGLCVAGLNFVGNAVYKKPVSGKNNIAQFEFIPWILGSCATVKEAKLLLNNINITDETFGSLPAAELHWLIADKNEAVTVEATEDGVKVYDNPAGVLTNNPPFDKQMFNLNNYMSLSPYDPENRFSDALPLGTYCRGMGALGLPGDLSSQSRFVRAAFTRLNSVSGDSEEESVSQLFHILETVSQTRGCCIVGEGKFEITVYTSCCNADKGVYYYTSYDNRGITAVDMRREDLGGGKLSRFPFVSRGQIIYQN